MTTVQLHSPPGYGVVTPLDRVRHAGMGLKASHSYHWTSGMHAVFINAIELFKAALDFPIAFAREPKSGEYVPMAVLGLRQGENVFVDANGRWRPHTYIPAYFRRFPFCIAELPPKAGEDQPQRLVCVQEDHLTKDSPVPLFKVDGEPAPQWAPIMQLLEAIEGARQQTRVLTRRLEALELLVPFDAVTTSRSGERLRLAGMFRVDEEKLADVPGKDMRAMFKKGELRAIYAHLLSLENFARLLDYAPAPA